METVKSLLRALPSGGPYYNGVTLDGVCMSMGVDPQSEDRAWVLADLRKLEQEGRVNSYVSGHDLKERFVKVALANARQAALDLLGACPL